MIRRRIEDREILKGAGGKRRCLRADRISSQRTSARNSSSHNISVSSLLIHVRFNALTKPSECCPDRFIRPVEIYVTRICPLPYYRNRNRLTTTRSFSHLCCRTADWPFESEATKGHLPEGLASPRDGVSTVTTLERAELRARAPAPAPRPARDAPDDPARAREVGPLVAAAGDILQPRHRAASHSADPRPRVVERALTVRWRPAALAG